MEFVLPLVLGKISLLIVYRRFTKKKRATRINNLNFNKLNGPIAQLGGAFD
jgi:hypothetical protein